MTLLRPMFPPRRADGEPQLAPSEVLEACDGERIVLLRPTPQRQKSCFELYPLAFFDPHHERRFWCVEPTGDYGADCETGRAYAVEFLQTCDRSNGWCALLGWIVADMIAAGRPNTIKNSNGLIVGFMSVIGITVALGADVAMEG